MPLVNGPYEDDRTNDGRRYKVPKALKRLQKQFTYEKKLAKFKEVFAREPRSDDELEEFADTYLIEVYNSGDDEI